MRLILTASACGCITRGDVYIIMSSTASVTDVLRCHFVHERAISLQSDYGLTNQCGISRWQFPGRETSAESSKSFLMARAVSAGLFASIVLVCANGRWMIILLKRISVGWVVRQTCESF